MKKTKKDYPPEWPEIAEKIKWLDGWQCQECGLQFSPDVRRVKDKNGRYQVITVHHKDRNPMNCADENLVTLCSACHCRAELPMIRRELFRKKHKGQVELEL